MSDTAVASPTPDVSVAIPASPQEPTSDTAGTVQTNGSQAPAAAPSEETFFTGDPNSLPPELKQAYTNMLKDYKSKTQSIADVRKKADAYDKVSKDQRFVDYWNGLSRTQKAEIKEQKAEVEKKLGEKISDEEFTKAFNSKDDFLSLLERVVQDRSEKSQKQIEKLEQQLSVKEAKDVVNDFAMETGQDGKPLRPDFDKLDEDGLINGYVRLTMDPQKGLSNTEYAQKLQEGYDFAKKVSQKYYEQGKAEALKIIQQKTASSTQPPTQAAKGAYTGPDPKKITPAEAFQLAKKGIRVPRDD